MALLDPALWAEVASNVVMLIPHPRALLRLAHHHVVARMTQRWVARLSPNPEDTVLYTWWFDGTTLGAARYADRFGIPVITRAHGYDLYEARHQPPYIPFRRKALSLVRAVFSASEAGAAYLRGRYPEAADRVHTALLGVEEPGFQNPASADGVFRIASCSFLVAVKRMDLLARGLAEAARSQPERRFRWVHIGDGPEREMVEAAAKSLPENAEFERIAYRGRRALYEYYRTHPVDVFANTSASEGTPVAVMEAISVGIPVMATSVGGNPEIVGDDNGVLIPANPSPAEIGRAINALAARPDLAALRRGSRARWQVRYSAARNYSEFAELIRAL
jgi:glycosyltransferase involved in cell wall biosynthesis